MKKIFIRLAPEVQGSDYYRKVLPYRHCQADLEKEGIILEIDHKFDPSKHYDAFLISNLVNPDTLHHLFARAVRGQSKIFWDIDDNYWAIPDYNPLKMDQLRFDCIANALGMCEMMSVSTTRLQSFVKAKITDSKPMVVLPNLVDLEDWQQPVKTHQLRDPDDLIIAWAGTHTHKDDLLSILDDLKAVCRDRVKFLVFGDIEPKIAIELKHNILNNDWVGVQRYPSVLRSWKPDIGIAPLLDHEFNQCKTACKYLELVMAGASVITSPIGEYRDMFEIMFNPTAERIQELISYPHRKKVHQRQCQEVHNDWSWQNPKKKELWMNFFREMTKD